MTPPTVQHLALTFADGTVGIMAFVTDDPRSGWSRLATAEQVESDIARTEQALAPEKVPVQSWRFIDSAEIPQDRTYRNALRDTGRALDYDMAHAKALHRVRLRVERAPLLAALDVAYQRADEAADVAEKQRIVSEKQALRDVTDNPAIDQAKTIDDLAALWR